MLKENNVYKLKGGTSVKEGYADKKVKFLKSSDGGGTHYFELLQNIKVNGKLIAPKGTVLHIFSDNAVY